MAMARLTLTQIRSNVREMTETSTNDVSDSLMNLFIRDGYNRIIDLERRWPFLEVSFSFTTVAGQRSYNIDDYTSDDIREVISIVDGENVRLNLVSYDLAEANFIGPSDVDGRPFYVAFWAGQLHLFPSPSGAYLLQVRAYREPEDWITSGGEVDGPEAFDLALIDYAVSRVYKMQEAFGPAQEFERSFNDTVAFARRDIMKPESYRPMVLSGGGRARRWGTLDY
jgi:hypothetical protein